MQNIVRAFALTLVVTGAFASTHTNKTSDSPVVAKYLGVPTCPPNDPNACHMYDHGK